VFEPRTAVLQPAAGQVTGVVSVSVYELVIDTPEPFHVHLSNRRPLAAHEQL
jgi:hypothetical protein